MGDQLGAARRELLHGWGRTSPSVADVHRPLTDDHVIAHVASAGPRGVLARGLGRSYGDAAQNAGGTVLDTTALAGVRHADLDTGEVTVAAGASIGDLIRWFVPHGWFPPVVPGTRHVTVGGAIAADIHGKNHHVAGSFASHVTALTLATPGGIRRAAPDDDPDVFWATTGGMGLTGVVLDATIRLQPVRTAAIRLVERRTRDLDETLDALEREDRHHTYSVAWIDCSSPATRGRSVLSFGEHAASGEAASPGRRDEEDRARVSLPAWWSWRVLNPAVLRAFNEAWWRRAPSEARSDVVPHGRFFFPLDGVGDWNRLYGAKGFLQYQLVVPYGREDVLRRIVEEATARTTVLLAVLKRFGEATPGMLSFPVPGWTLALDIPVGAPGLAERLDHWDELVATAGGRLYLAKDSRTRPSILAAMYPELARWQEVRERVDPDGTFESDLARRLELTSTTRTGSTTARPEGNGGKVPA